MSATRTNDGIWTCWCGWIFETDTRDIREAAREHMKRHKCRKPLLVDGVDREHAHGGKSKPVSAPDGREDMAVRSTNRESGDTVKANTETQGAWGRAWDRALAQGYDHGYAAHVADEAVAREKAKERCRSRQPRTPRKAGKA